LNHPDTSTACSKPVALTSDNIAGASPEIIEAIAACNAGQAQAYGDDGYTQRVEERFAALFEREVQVFLVTTGSAANALCLSVLAPPWGNVFCHPEAHINVDECGAPEFFTGGAKLVSVEGPAAKLDSMRLRHAAARDVGDVHTTQPACVSITQATEVGSVYSVAEIEAISRICKDAGLRLHMDGARFANALVATGATPAELTWKAGVDALSFGATKNGVLTAEAILLFDSTLATEMAYRRKRGGHLLSKMRMLAAQMDTYLANDLWLANAEHANAMARRLAAGLRAIDGVQLHGETEANIVFCSLPQAVVDVLLAQGFHFYSDRWGPGVIRLVSSFATPAQAIDDFVAAVDRLMRQ
jgi:threonine aldolase